jgi:hypothetical protein
MIYKIFHIATKKHKKAQRGSADLRFLCFFVAKNRLTSPAVVAQYDDNP